METSPALVAEAAPFVGLYRRVVRGLSSNRLQRRRTRILNAHTNFAERGGINAFGWAFICKTRYFEWVSLCGQSKQQG